MDIVVKNFNGLSCVSSFPYQNSISQIGEIPPAEIIGMTADLASCQICFKDGGLEACYREFEDCVTSSNPHQVASKVKYMVQQISSHWPVLLNGPP